MGNNTRQHHETYRRYILDNITPDGYDDSVPDDSRARVHFLARTFASEYGWCIDAVGVQKALTEWLMGLPSSVSLDFYNHAILERGEKFGAIARDASERKQDAFLERYWAFMAMRIKELFKEHGADPKTDGRRGEYVAFGRTFKTRVFGSDASANEFMRANPGWGCIGLDDATVHVARIDDKGEKRGTGE